MGLNPELLSRRQFFARSADGGGSFHQSEPTEGGYFPATDDMVSAVRGSDDFVRELLDDISPESHIVVSGFFEETTEDQPYEVPSLSELYFRDVSRVCHVSSPEKDFAHGDQIQAKLRAEAELASGPVLESRRNELLKIIADGRNAQEELVHSYLPFAASFAKKNRGRGVVVEDLIQEASLGLMRAARDYDPDYQSQSGRQTLSGRMRFGTYAGWWIRNQVTRAIENQGRPMRHSNNMEQAMSKIHKFRSEYIGEHGVEPTLDELRILYEAAPVSSIRFDGAYATFSSQTTQRFYSLERETTGDESDLVLKDAIPDIHANVERDVLDRDPRSMLFDIITSVITNDRQLHILTARYGLDGQEPRTLEAIGQEYGVTREAIRQQEAKALKKLREALPPEYKADLEYFGRDH